MGDRKFCYQGNATDESAPNGSAYAFHNEAFSDDLPCSALGNENAGLLVDVVPDDDIELDFGLPVCSFEDDACVDTVIRAVIEVVESDV